jgi:hypothetical protein
MADDPINAKLSDALGIDDMKDLTVEVNDTSLTVIDPESLPAQQRNVQRFEDETVTHHTDFEDDYDFARNKMRSILEKGEAALGGIIELADSSENARAYEVVAQLIKNLSEASEKIVGLHKLIEETKGEVSRRRKLNADSQNPPGNQGEQSPSVGSITNQTFFMGSTTDLLNELKKHDVIEGRYEQVTRAQREKDDAIVTDAEEVSK